MLSTFTISGIILLVTAGMYILVNPIVHQTSASILGNDASTPAIDKSLHSSCVSSKILKGLQMTPMQQQSAIFLAEGSKIFQDYVNGQNYTLSSVGPSYAFDEKTCSNFTLNAVGVYFKLGNGSSLDVYEDGNISKITGARIPFMENHGPWDYSGARIPLEGNNSQEDKGK